MSGMPGIKLISKPAITSRIGYAMRSLALSIVSIELRNNNDNTSSSFSCIIVKLGKYWVCFYKPFWKAKYLKSSIPTNKFCLLGKYCNNKEVNDHFQPYVYSAH